MSLPGSPRLHVWTGLLVAAIGIFAGGYAYTGDRIYHLEYLALALFGFALLILGGVLAGYGQANRPRLGQKSDEPLFQGFGTWFASLPFVDHEPEADHPGDEDDETLEPEEPETEETEAGPDTIEAQLACPDCSATFTRAGVVPFDATCPECGYRDTISEVPD